MQIGISQSITRLAKGPTTPESLWGNDTSLLAYWRADTGITIETGVRFWASRLGSQTLDKSNTSNQPAFNASNSSFGGQPTIDYTAASNHGLDVGSGFPDCDTDQLTVIFVGSQTNAATSTMWEWSAGAVQNSGASLLYVHSDTTLRGRAKDSGGTNRDASYTTSVPIAANIWITRYDGANSPYPVRLYDKTLTERGTNTAGVGGLPATALSRFFLGRAANNSASMTGSVAEVLVFKRLVPDIELTAYLDEYARPRYGL